MTTETQALTDVEIGAIIGRVYQKTHSKEIGELRFKADVVAIGRAIEQAVLQSDQVQAWKRLAEMLEEKIESYERYGPICTFEGDAMIHASHLYELSDAMEKRL